MRISTTEIVKTTCDFYSCFCGADISKAKHDVQFVCTEDRDHVLKGYGCKYTIFMLIRDKDCIVSYSPAYQPFFVEQGSQTDIQKVIDSINRRFPLKGRQLMVFVEERISNYGKARMLTPADYSLYEAFFRKAHPSASGLDWLKEYFEEKAEKELFFGYIVDGELVSVCDAPDMPYMEGAVQHTGILTLPEYRRKGYAKCCAALAAHHHIGKAIVPQWDCALDNKASIALAKSIGYEEFAQAFFFEE